MERVWTFGTVRIEATGLLPTVVQFSDTFGYRREVRISLPDLDAVEWSAVADLHRRLSQASTRRN